MRGHRFKWRVFLASLKTIRPTFSTCCWLLLAALLGWKWVVGFLVYVAIVFYLNILMHPVLKTEYWEPTGDKS